MASNISFYGKMGSGKTTAAAYLNAKYGQTIHKISEPIYALAEKLWGPEARKDRALLQDVGMKMREIDPDVWINAYVRELEGKPAVVNDTLRFANEWWALKEHDFVIVQVITKEASRVDRLQRVGRLQSTDRLNHVSETDLDDKAVFVPDFVLYNEGDQCQFRDALDDLWYKIEAST